MIALSAHWDRLHLLPMAMLGLPRCENPACRRPHVHLITGWLFWDFEILIQRPFVMPWLKHPLNFTAHFAPSAEAGTDAVCGQKGSLFAPWMTLSDPPTSRQRCHKCIGLIKHQAAPAPTPH